LLLATLLVAVPVAATAAPTTAKRAEALKVKAQVDALDEQLEQASEDYNEANGRYKDLTSQVKKTQTRLGELESRQQVLQAHLDTRIDGMYRTGPLGFLEILLNTRTFEEFSTTWDVLAELNEQDALDVAELKVTRAELAQAQTTLKQQQASAKQEADTMRGEQQSVERKLAERKRLLSGLESEIRQLEAEAEATRERAARAAIAPAVPRDSGGNPSTAPKSGVVGIAMSKLGSPYKWAADGPNSFDCSGFTMWVYRQVGVSLPHSSRAQYNVGQRVSRSNLKPGDLVFFGRSRIHHVGIYVGGNQYIHSPNTGDVVKVSSLNRTDYVGAVRP
jgi:cell wall-associated NlpC family hydrolase